MISQTSRNQQEFDQKTLLAVSSISGWLILIGMVILLLIHPVSATNITISAENVNQYSLSADSGYVIYQIIIDPLPMGTNQTHVLNSNGAQFFLEIDSKNSYFIYNDFWITMTYPNGTQSTLHKEVTRLSGSGYKTTIQPVFSQIQSITNIYWIIDLQVGIADHVSAEFNSPPADNNLENSIPFSSVSGEFSGVPTNVYAEEMSLEDFQNNVVNYNPLFGVGNLVSEVTGWSWSIVLQFINMIPVVGPQLLTMVTFVTDTGGEIIFWLGYIAINMMLVIGGGEILLLVFAFLLAGKRPTPEKFVNNFVNYNVKSVTGFLWIGGLLYGWLLAFVRVVAQIIRG